MVGQVAIRHDAVLLRSANQVVVLPVRTVLSIRYYDSDANINRRFIVSYDSSANRRIYTLYEVVVSGEVLVVRKPRYTGLVPHENRETNFYYFVVTNGRLISFKQFKDKLLPELENSELSITEYRKVNKLDPRQPAGIIRIVQYYNRCSTSGVKMAMK